MPSGGGVHSINIARRSGVKLQSRLTLQSDDIALTEDSGVGKALAGLQKELADELQFPDEIYFIETDLEQGPWLVWPMKYDDKFRPVEDWTGWTHTEFCVDTLIDLTREGA